jgi:hypothetical protein
LRAAGLDGPEVAVAPHAETAGQVQGVHSLGLKLPKHGPAHGLQLLVQLLAELREVAGRTVTEVLGWDGVGMAASRFTVLIRKP